MTLVEGIWTLFTSSFAGSENQQRKEGGFLSLNFYFLFFSSFDTCSNTNDLYVSDMDVHVCIFKVRDASCTQTSLGQCKC